MIFTTVSWILTILAVFTAMAVILYTRRQVAVFTDEMIECIEKCLRGEKYICAEESLQDKVRSCLIDMYRTMEMRQQAVETERKNLQEMISDVSHQLKTPVTNLKILNETMLEQAEGRQKDFLWASAGQLAKLEFLMEALVKSSKLETGLITLKKEDTRVCDTIAEALGGIILEAERKRIAVRVNCPSDLKAFYDSKWTTEAVFNLLDNAVKYTPENGHVDIKAEKQDLYLHIQVTDDGPGIPEASQGKIWKRFYREETVRNTEGVGLGLFLVRQIVTLQGGYVKMSAALGQGSAFFICLPLK